MNPKLADQAPLLAKWIEKEFLESLILFEKDLSIVNSESGNKTWADLTKRLAYIAFKCGGGEVALYTLIGTYFRNQLGWILPNCEPTDPKADLRLSIDSSWMTSGYRPDFQVYSKQLTKSKPMFAVEFKALDLNNATKGQIAKVIEAIRGDAYKLQGMLKLQPDARAALVVFIHSLNDEKDNKMSDVKLDIATILKPKSKSNTEAIRFNKIALVKGVAEAGYISILHLGHDQVTAVPGVEVTTDGG